MNIFKKNDTEKKAQAANDKNQSTPNKQPPTSENAKPEADPEKAKESLMDVRSLKSGDYFLHFYVQETRGLVHPTSANSTVDPVIKVMAFGKEKRTSQKDNRGTGMIYWGEHIFLENRYEEPSLMESDKLRIAVMDHNLVGSDALVGEFELELSSIYFSPNHCIEHRWVALANISKDYNAIKGFLKFSVNFVGPGEDQVKLEDEKVSTSAGENLRDLAGKGGMDSPQVILPPQLQTSPQQLKISLIRAENLVQMDFWGGSIDSYLVFQFGAAKFVTETIKDTKSPVWGQNIYLPYSEPTIASNIAIKVFDWDRGSKDELVGSSSFNIRNVKSGLLKNFFWMNIYGSQTEGDEKHSAVMNSSPDLGSFWKGRVLLKMETYPVENPKLECEPVDPKIMSQYTKSDVISWTILGELFYGTNFPSNDEKYSIQIRWADQEINFENKKGNGGVWEWFIRQRLNCSFPYLSSEELPDVFIYLVQDKKRISFIRKPAKYFITQLTAEPRIFYFKPDKSKSPDMRDDQAGLVKMRITLGNTQAFTDASVGGWDKPINKPFTKQGLLCANIFYAQDLVPADDDGTSDPYLKLSYYGHESKTEIIEDTLNPIWYQRLEMSVPLFPTKDAPPIIIKLYDHDTFGDDFMGNCIVDLMEGIKDQYITINKVETPKPCWLKLRYNKNNECGRILVSFNFFDMKPVGLPQTIYPEMDRYECKIRILGLRDLKSLGLLPVRRAFIKFDINSLRTKQEKQSLKEKKAIFTEPKDTGSNPNISTIINFDLNLPRDVDLCPSLSCTVFDCVLKGLAQPTLGVFSIDLSHFIKKTRRKFEVGFEKAGNKISLDAGVNVASTKAVKEKILTGDPKGLDIPARKEDHQVINLESSKKNGQYTQFIDEDERGNFKHVNVDNKSSTVMLPDRATPVIDETGKIFSENITKKPKYQVDPTTKQAVEVDIPDEKLYLALGWDPKKERIGKEPKKHYRYFVNDELEKTPFMDKDTFDEFTITRGKRKAEETLVSNENIGVPNSKGVGKFKGWVEIMSETDRKKYVDSKAGNFLPGIGKNAGGAGSQNQVQAPEGKEFNLDKEFLVKKELIVRVYICRAISLPALDDGSLSDPYLQIKLGKTVINNEKEFLKDQTNADFFTMFELRTVLPGNSLLHVQVWDHDDYLKDDLIGETVIDLENRFFSKKWRNLSNIPVETRELFHPESTVSRGRVLMWVELIDIKDTVAIQKKWDIKPQPPKEYEVRAVVWECEDVPANDIEDCSDLFVTGRVGETTLKTDVHYRSQNGSGSFNWRMVFPITLPIKDPSITFQIWDKDILTGDDFISEASISFAKQALEAFENDCTVKIKNAGQLSITGGLDKMGKGLQEGIGNIGKGIGGGEKGAGDKEAGPTPEQLQKSAKTEDKFTIDLMNAKKEGYSQMKEIGKLTLSFEMVPGDAAKLNPVGQGRGEPNTDPWLPPPVGRFQFSWNPYTLFTRLIGPKARKQCCIFCCIVLCLAIVIALFPVIMGNVMSAPFVR